jgi:hypothetical protein
MTNTDLLFAEDAKAASQDPRSLHSRDGYTASIILLIAVPLPY